MSAVKLSLYLYRVFAVVFASCKLYLVAQEVDFKMSWPFPTLRNCQRTSSVSVTQVQLGSPNLIEARAIENPLEFARCEPVPHCSSLKINNKPCDEISACKRKR